MGDKKKKKGFGAKLLKKASGAIGNIVEEVTGSEAAGKAAKKTAKKGSLKKGLKKGLKEMKDDD